MVTENHRDDLTVQGKPGSYRISVPKDWVTKVKEKESNDDQFIRKQIDDYLVAYPPQEEERLKQIDIEDVLSNFLEYRNALTEANKNISESGTDSIEDSFVSNIVQSFINSGIETINLNLEKIENDFERANYEDTELGKHKEHLRDSFSNLDDASNIDFESKKNSLKIKRETSDDLFDDFVVQSRDFLWDYLLRPVLPIYEEKQFSNVSKLSDREEDVDIKRSLSDYQNTDILLNMNRPQFGRSLGRMYVTAHLERACDIVERIVRTMSRLEQRDGFEEVAAWLRDEMAKILTTGIISRQDSEEFSDYSDAVERVENGNIDKDQFIDSRFEELAFLEHTESDKSKTEEDILLEYLRIYFHETREYFLRVERLERMRDEKFESISEKIPDDTEGGREHELIEAGMIVGQILAYVEQLVRLPRSMAKARLSISMLEHTRGLGQT